MLLVCVVGTRDQIPHLHDVRHQRVSLRDNLVDLVSLLTTRSYLSICLAWLVMVVSFGILGVVGTYAYLYGFELSTEEMSIQRFVMIPGMLAALPLAAWLTRRLDKKPTVICASVLGAALVGLPPALKMIGFFPPNDSAWMLPALFGSLFLAFSSSPSPTSSSTPSSPTSPTSMSTGPGAARKAWSSRYGRSLQGDRRPRGPDRSFGLEIIGFPEHATQEMLTPEMLNGLFFMTGPLYWLFVAAGMGLMALYAIDERRHGAMIEELKARRAAAADRA